MPRMELDSQNKQVSDFEYPKLFLKKGDRTRIVCIEKTPLAEYVHTLRAPTIQNGHVVMEEVKDRKGELVSRPKYDFIGRPICSGDFETLDKKLADPENCPACAVAVSDDAVAGAERRYAMHVIVYATKAGSFTLAEPYTVTLKAWTFGGKLFNQLVDIKDEWGDIRSHDLNLGPCEVEQFQRFEIAVASKAAWLENDTTKQQTLEVYNNNKSKDLSTLIGRRVSADAIGRDVEIVLQKNRQAFGGGGEDLSPDEVAVGMDLDSLLTADPETKPEPTKPEEPETALDELVTADVTEPAEVTAAPEEKGENLDLEDLTKLLDE